MIWSIRGSRQSLQEMKDLISIDVVYRVKRCPTRLSTCSLTRQPEAENGCEAIREYLPRILRQILTLEQVSALSGSQPVVVNDIMQWFAFDSMGEFAFNEDFGVMKSGKWHFVVTQQRSALALLGSFNPAIWIIRLALAFAPFFWRVRDRTGMMAFCDSRMEQRLKVGTIPSCLCVTLSTDVAQSRVEDPDIAAWFINEMDGNRSIADKRAQWNLLSGNTVSVIVGGR